MSNRSEAGIQESPGRQRQCEASKEEISLSISRASAARASWISVSEPRNRVWLLKEK